MSGPAPRDFRARVGVDGQPATEPGLVRVDDIGLSAGALRVAYDEVETLERADLSIVLTLFGGTRLLIDRGGSLDDLWEILRQRFRARVSDSLRFAPSDPRHTFDALLRLDAVDGFPAQPARVAVTRLGPNYLCDAGPCAQLPFGAIGEAVFESDAWRVTIPLEPGPAAPAGGRLELTKLARRTDEFLEVLAEARAASLADTARSLDLLAPDLPAAKRTALTDALRVGRLVSRERFEALASGGWAALWAAAAGPARAPYRDALEQLAGADHPLWIGLRPYGGVPRAADEAEATAPEEADPDSDFPVVYAAALLPGATAADDRLALEVLSETDHATYVYRVAPAPPGLARRAAAEWLAATASHTLLALDFKKEPLYLPEAELLAAREGLYRAAWRRLPGLTALRGRLIGRALHTSPTAWAEQLRTLA